VFISEHSVVIYCRPKYVSILYR